MSVSILQTLVLIAIAVFIFDVKIAGNMASILLLALIGGGVFVSLGFAISGWAKSEEVAAPIANVVALPMMFLSGVFFPRSAMPDVLITITDFLPLTYLIDALRNVAIDGEALWHVDGNHLHRLEIEVESEAAGNGEHKITTGGSVREHVSDLESKGTATLTVHFEPVEEKD